MQYSSHPITSTHADTLVVPCGMDSEVLLGTTQEEVFQKYGMNYTNELQADLVSELMEVGAPGIFHKHPDPMVLNVPMYDKFGVGIQEAMLLSSLQEVVKFVATNDGRIRTIAIGGMGYETPWEVVEAMCELEERRHRDEIEFILYPPQELEGEDGADELITLHPDPTTEEVAV